MSKFRKIGDIMGKGEMVEREGECEIHGKFTSQCATFGGMVLGPYCQLCEDERDIIKAKKIAENEAKKEAERIENERLDYLRNMDRMNVEPAYYKASLDNFKASTPELAYNLSRVRSLVSGDIEKIVMTGKNGTGKTHLACAALHALGGKIMTMYEISTTIRASYSRENYETELQIVDAFARLPLFVIDEIGRTKGGDSEANWLSYIIDKRHVRGLPTILISNKHVRKSCKANGCPECLENYIGEDIMSRLTQGGILLTFSGDDYRRGKN